MTTASLPIRAVGPARCATRRSLPLPRARHGAGTALLWTALTGNATAVLFIWVHNGGITQCTGNLADLLTSVGRLFGLTGAFLMLLQVVLVSRIPALERRVGFDRLSGWHRRTGAIAILLVIAHGPLIVAGYARTGDVSLTNQVSQLLGVFPGMVTALIGTALILSVFVTSIVVVRCRLRYEAWYAVHLSVYAGIVLTYFHEVQDGQAFVTGGLQRTYWMALYLVPLAMLLTFRVIRPLAQACRYRMRVVEVRREARDVVSIVISGRNLHKLPARGGQFFRWRFLARGLWTESHPFSLSAAPDGRTLRITVKALGDYTTTLASVTLGARVIAEGPFGRLVAERQRCRRAVMIGGGIGITPLVAIAEELLAAGHPVSVLHRVRYVDDLVLDDELAAGNHDVHPLVGPRLAPELEARWWPRTLARLVPDIAKRDVYLCGPLPMMRAVRAALAGLGVPAQQIHSEQFSFAAKSD